MQLSSFWRAALPRVRLLPRLFCSGQFQDGVTDQSQVKKEYREDFRLGISNYSARKKRDGAATTACNAVIKIFIYYYPGYAGDYFPQIKMLNHTLI